MSGIKHINKSALFTLKAYKNRLTVQEYKTLRGQILAGEDTGALKGLKRILRKGCKNECYTSISN